MTNKKKAPKKRALDERALAQWRSRGKTLRVSQHQWEIADWILRGEKIFKSKKKAYDEAVELTGMTRETLQVFASTARNVLTRVKELSFGHHRLVAKYTPEKQKELLQCAKDAKESVDAFAARLRNGKGDAALAPHGEHADLIADKVILAFTKLVKSENKSDNFKILSNDPPTPAKQAKLLDALEKAARRINDKIEELKESWKEAADADAAFEREVGSKSVTARGVAAGK